MKSLFLLLTLLVVCPFTAYSFDPVAVDANTIGLWNFDGETDDQVYDQGVNGIDGTAVSVSVVSGIPGLDPLFAEARQVIGDGFIDLGEVNGSPLELTGATQASVEALIHLTQSADGQHIIFSSDQVEVMIINNYLAAFIRLAGGKYGVVSEILLNINTTYRVKVSFGNGRLGIYVDGQNHGLVQLEGAIATIPTPGGFQPHGFIGGNMFAQSFPGYIDDVRFSNIMLGDIEPPTIVKVSPATSSVEVARPNFEFSLSDVGSGVNTSSVIIYLNDVVQNGLTITTSSITGQMSDDLLSSQVNHVKIFFTDNVGNETEESFYFTFTNILARTEYQTDQYTIGLWHMNDFAPEIMLDSSGLGADGFGVTGQVATGDGVFSKGRYFQGTDASKITIKSVLIPDNQFTFETWIRPTADYPYPTQQEYIFDNGQIRIARYNGGHIRVTFLQARDSRIFESAIPLLPVGELHHFAVSWDGSKESDNLLIFIDSGIMQKFDAPFDCDFAPIPVIAEIGRYFNGMMDEMRFSSVVRDGFNIPTFETRIIDFLTLGNGVSTDAEFPELQIMFNSDTTITPANVKVKLNGIIQPATANLVITANSINGTMTDAVVLGLNTIEVDFLDDSGNQKKKRQYFYYIKKNVGQQYEVDENTVGLWHFSFDGADSSGNGYHLSDGSLKEGVIGNGWSGHTVSENNVIDINSKEFTIESWFKREDTTTNEFLSAFELTGTSFFIKTYINYSTGDVRVNYYTPEVSVDQTIAGVFPTDGNYHHLAIVYNGCNDFAQMLLLIDGEVKKTFNAPSYCRVLNPLSMVLAFYNWNDDIQFDEIRISSKAKYDFNLGEQVKPTKVSFTPDEKFTTHDFNQNVSFSFSSPNGISSDKTYVVLNGSVESGLTLNQSGIEGTLSGTFTNVISGANRLQLIVNDNNGNQQEFAYFFYAFSDGGIGNYTADSNTIGLWHMDENSGNIFNDSSGNGYHVDMGGLWTWETGVFGTSGLYPSSLLMTPIPVIDDLTTFTFEGWFYATPSGASILNFRTGGTYLLSSPGSSTIELTAPTSPYATKIFSQEMNFTEGFHHAAIVADSNHPYQNYYLLIAGEVVYSTKLSIGELTLDQNGNFYFTGNNTMDEIRFSDTARYELNFKLAK